MNQGHRKIGLITGEFNKITVQDRLDGFETALTCAGIPFDREKYLEHGAFNRRSGGYDATMTLLQHNKDDLPTALCAASASMLMGAFAAIRDYGLRVPEDISLIGIDEVDMTTNATMLAPVYTTPPLSIVATSCEAAAKETVLRLIELVEEGKASQSDYVIPDVDLYLRKSVRQIQD